MWRHEPIERGGNEVGERLTSDRDLADFLLRACHDLRSPVRAIRAHAELVRKTTGAGDPEQSLGFIIDNACRIELLVEGLAGYANALHIGADSFQPTPMDVVLRNATSRLQDELRDCGVTVTCDELPSVSGNADLLIQVFEQLLRNAVRHGGRSSLQIHVAARREGNEWLFTIQDNGRGIEAAYLERIFRPFERLDAPKNGGAGLGLAICREIVEHHRGRIWAESTPERGSTFCFTLPIIDE